MDPQCSAQPEIGSFISSWSSPGFALLVFYCLYGTVRRFEKTIFFGITSLSAYVLGTSSTLVYDQLYNVSVGPEKLRPSSNDCAYHCCDLQQ